MLSLAPALVALVALVTQTAALPSDLPYCGIGAWQNTDGSTVPQDMGGLKLTAYSERTLQVTGVFSNLPGYVLSVKLVVPVSPNAIQVLDLTDAFAKGVTSGVVSATYDLTDISIYNPEFIAFINRVPSNFPHVPAFLLLNYLDAGFKLLMETSNSGNLVASVGSCFQRLCFTSKLSAHHVVPPPTTIGTARVKMSIGFNGELHLQGEFENLNGTTTMAHIHAVTAVANVPPSGPATTLPSLIGFPLGVHDGKFDVILELSNQTSFNSMFLGEYSGSVYNASNTMINAIADGHAYMNIHTTTYPNGEIAGFFTPCGQELPQLPQIARL